MLYLSKSHFAFRLARRLFQMLIIVPAVCMALDQNPAARSIALLSLDRKRGYVLGKAMEGDRDVLRQYAPRGAHRVIRVLYD